MLKLCSILHSNPKGTQLPMRKITILAVPAALVVGLLAGCAGSPASSNGTVSDNTPAASSTPKATKAAAATPKFGQAYTFNSGLKITIGAPEAFTPSQFASGAAANNIKMTVTVVNGTDKTITPAIFQFTATAGGQAGAEVIDSEQHVSTWDSVSNVAPGATASYVVGFGFAGAADGVTVTVDPVDFVSKPATFTS